MLIDGLRDSSSVQELGPGEHEKMPRYTVAAFKAGDASREKLHQLPLGCACQCLRYGARHERHVAGDERVFFGVSQLSKKGFGRIVGRQALALENLIGGFKQWSE